MTTNPSHILIARGSRGHNPSAALSSPTETHAAASGIFRSSTHHPALSNGGGSAGSSTGAHMGHGYGASSGQWYIEELVVDSERGNSDIDAPFQDVEIDETFARAGRFPGTVKIVVEGTTFW